MAKNQINNENCMFENVHNYIYTNEEKPLENISLNWLSGSSCFKGREDILIQIKELFETKNRVVLYGAPGIGKTETARQFAERYSEYFNGNLIWVYAETPQNIQKSFEELASSLKHQTSDVSQVYSKFVNSRCLIVFDNVDNMAAIGNYLPSNTVHATLRILITSQFGEWDASLHKLRIDTLNPKDAVDIIGEKLGDIFYKNPQIDWYKLVERLDCIPLSIQIISSLLYEKFRTNPIGNCNFDAFINELMDGTFINSNFLIFEQNLYNKTVLSSIYSALNRLKMKEALDLLTFIAYLDADYIYHDDLLLVPSIKKSNDKLQEALNKLKDYSLIQFDFEENDYKIKVHRTIQLVLRKYDLKKRNKKMFKVIFKIILSNPGLLLLHNFTVLKYAEMEKFQKKIIKFYKKNETQVDSYLPLLARNHCDKILQKLLPKFRDEFDKTQKYNKILNEMLLKAILRKNTDMHTIDLLINYGAKISSSLENNWTNGFHHSYKWLSIDLFDRLLKSNDSENIIDLKDKAGRTILHLLVLNSDKNNISKSIECMDHLISKWNANISIQDNKLNTIIHTAFYNKNICLEMIKYLVKKCNCKNLVNTQNTDGETPIQILLRFNFDNCNLFEIVFYFINECEADTTIPDNELDNILHVASKKFNISLEIIKYLVEKCNCKYLVNSQNKNGYTPLHFIFVYNDNNSDLFKIVSYFINECEADITIQNKHEWNTLFFACCDGTAEIINFILRSINCREMINIQNEWGDVAFTQLIYNESIKEDEKIELMKLFIENEMDFKIRNKFNKTLAEIAKKEEKLLKLSDELKRQEKDIPNVRKKCVLQ